MNSDVREHSAREHIEPEREERAASGPDHTNASLRAEHLSHDALALDLSHRGWSKSARYVAAWVTWLFWNGTRWAKDENHEAVSQIRVYLRERAREVLTSAASAAKEAGSLAEAQKIRERGEREARILRDKHNVVAVEQLARSNAESRATPEDFDVDPLLLGTPGGTVDLRTGEIREARPEDMITRLTRVAPLPGRPALWLRFLDETFGGNEDLIAFLQRLLGYALTGEIREQKIFFAYGTGANGKSVLLDTIMHIMGDYARSAPDTLLLATQSEKHPTDLAGLQGARLVVGSEVPRGRIWDEARLKKLTGGDQVTARFMRGNFFSFTPQFTLMIAGNTLPHFMGMDEAIRRRMVVIPFERTVPPDQRDPLLAERLKQEAGQILNWASEGAVEWHRRGLDVPEKVLASSQDYLEGEDLLEQFLNEETVRKPGAFTASSALLDRSRQWSARHGHEPWTARSLVKELKARGLKYHRTPSQRGFAGLTLKD